MRILLIKTSSLGDIIHAMPVLHDINKNFPLAVIDWVVEESFASILNTHKHIHKIIPIAWRRWRKNLLSLKTITEIKNFYNMLHEENYDHIIDMQGLIKSAVPSFLAKSNKSIIHGYANKSQQAGYEPLAKLAYTQKVPIPFKCHAVTRNRLLCSQSLGYTISESDVNFDFKENNTQNNKQIIFGHGTSQYDKEWGVNNWIDLGAKLSLENEILLPWGNSYEKHNCLLIKNGIIEKNSNAIVKILDKTSLEEIFNIIKQSSFFIGVDTGLSHIASALNIPSVVIYKFDTTWRTHAFWSDNVHSIYDNPPVNVQEVYRHFRELNEKD